MYDIFSYIIVFLAICFIILYLYLNVKDFWNINKENFQTLVASTIPTITVQNDAKIRALYEFDEKRDESHVNFDVIVPQNLISTIDSKTMGQYDPYQLTGFCSMPSTNKESIVFLLSLTS